MKKSILFLLMFSVLSKAFPQIEQFDKNQIIAGLLIVKLKEDKKEYFSSSTMQKIRNELNDNAIVEIKKIFAYVPAFNDEKNKYGQPRTNLSLLYEIRVNENTNLELLAKNCMKTGNFEYAEPKFKQTFFETPNDPQVNGQYYLQIIKAFEAWETQQGDSNIVIGITDTGMDNDHEDLAGNVFYNYNDPINGIDDDFDGFTDNFRGWDMGENDNNPQIETNPHGIRVSGIASARTNNGIGIAGTGYRTKFLPVKITNASDVITHGYEGMVYAAEMGCQIVNCSWGGTNFSFFGRDVVNYVALDKDVLIVAACGNSSNEDIYYPASYDHVFSVAASNELNHIWTGSTYGVNVDITAPGEAILSPGLDNTYANRSGTSYASPIVAACAAIVKAQFPQYSGIQLGELLRKSTDRIDTIPDNTAFTGKIGSGRINLLKAINQTIPPSIVLHHFNPTDNNDNLFKSGDTVLLNGTITNYLANASYVNIIASCISPHIDFIESIAQFGSMQTYQNNELNNHLKFVVLPNVPTDEPIYIKLSISAGGYVSEQWLKMELNQNYLNLSTNKIATTIGGNGRIGYYKSGTSLGNGFVFNHTNLLYEGGLIIAGSSEKVASNCRRFDDFVSTQALTSDIFTRNGDSLQLIKAYYNDNNASDHKLPVEVHQKTFSWFNDDSFIINEYTVINPTLQGYSNLYAGFFTDWDIDMSANNRTAYDAAHSIGFSYNLENNIYYGAVAGISEANYHFYAFDNVQGGGGGIDISDEFTVEERWFALTNNRLTAGNGTNGSDVVQLLSAGPFNLPGGDSVKIAFAIIGGENQNIITNQAIEAKSRYQQLNPVLISPTQKIQIYPNPAKKEIFISGLTEKARVTIFNALGKPECSIETISGELNSTNLKPGMYLIKIQTGKKTLNQKIIISK